MKKSKRVARAELTPEVEARLTDAYAEITARQERVTVRSLRANARVSTDAAHIWLHALRPAPDTPPLPENFGEVIEPLWHAAIEAARIMLEQRYGEEREGLLAAEAETLTEVAAATQRAEHAEEQHGAVSTALDAVRGQLAEAQERAERAEAAQGSAADMVRDQLAAMQQRIDKAEAALAEAEQARHAAEVSEAEAQATARTLREVIDQQQKA